MWRKASWSKATWAWPTKVEGNPRHPASLGATDVHGQACVLDLYDPDRAEQITELGEIREWEEFLLGLHRALASVQGGRGEGLFLLTDSSTSPTLAAQIAAVLAAFPGAKWHQYSPASPHAADGGARLAYGRPVNTYYRLDRADVILALDSDFLMSGPGSTRYAHDYAMRRRVRGSNTSMNRLYSVESEMTVTGGKAEHRLALKHTEIEPFARELSAAVASGGSNPSGGPQSRWISALARDLVSHRGACAIIPGGAQGPAVHAIAHGLNAALGGVGTTVIHTDPIEIGAGDYIASLKDLTAELDAGHVKVLLMLGGNPVYDAPSDFDFAGRLPKAGTSIHVSLHRNETSALSRWVIP